MVVRDCVVSDIDWEQEDCVVRDWVSVRDWVVRGIELLGDWVVRESVLRDWVVRGLDS